MNAIVNVLKRPNILAALAVVIFIALIMFLGPILGITLMFRIVISIIIFLIVIIILLYKKMKDSQKAGQIEQSINEGADDQIQSVSPEKRAEIEQFKKQLIAAISSLKNSKLGKGKLGRSALYALPWYMIIGPSAAGKTTAIQNSGLEFPYGKDGFRGVGGTRNCDWFFSTKGIFLDTAGRYVSEPEDKVEWMAFLETLRKNRKRKPINGVMVAINVDEIINSENEALYEHARNIRKRIDELIENLGINFPVYFVFTKCDLIQGFVEYFGDFSEIERSQIWGSTFNTQQQLDPNPKNVFEEEFKKLSEKLFEIRTIRLSSPLKREQRRKVFLFPFQFQSLQKKLVYLIGEVFQPNPYQDNPIFRGFYFTSGTQEGAPLDLAISEIAKKFNLPESKSEDEEEIVETKNYFIKDLLNDIVIGDQNFSAGQTTSGNKKIRTVRQATIAASVFGFILIGLFTLIGFNGNSSLLNKISKTSDSFAKINWSGNLLNTFTKTDSLRSLIVDIQNGNANHSFVSFGLNRSDEALSPLNKLYITKSKDFFTRNIYDKITDKLNNYANGQDFSGEDIYNYLKTYLLIGNERSRLDTVNQKFIAKVFANILESNLLSLNSFATTQEKDSLKKLFGNYTSFFARQLSDPVVYSVKNDNILINLVRNRLQYKPNAESIYARLKQNGIGQYPNDLTLEQAIGGRYITVMQSDLKIPFIFTNDGWNTYVKQAINDESENPQKEDWVLGKRQINLSSDYTFDSAQMKKDLLKLYVNDYKQTWLEFLQNIRYGDFSTVPLAANNLKMLSDPVNSPVILILKVFSDQLQTLIDIQAPSDTSNKGKNINTQLNLSSSNIAEINKYRNFILGSQNGSQGGDLNAVIGQYGLLSGVLESIKGGQDLINDYAVKVLTQRAVELPTAKQAIIGALYNTPALQHLLLNPIRLTWSAILYDAAQYLNLQWKAKVVDAFNNSLANSFPFKNNSTDAPLQDFKDFFKPQDGTLWSFFNSELSPFINKDSWSMNQWENIGLGVSKEFLVSLKKADEITNVLFKNDVLNVSFRLKPQLPDSKPVHGQKPIVEQVYLYLDGVENYYKMGAPFWIDYNWPGNKGTPGARMNISVRDFGTSDTKSFDGDWALFRLLQDATVSHGGSSSQYIFNWFFKKENTYDVAVSYILNAGSSRNPFSAGFFKSFSIPGRIN
jgi:type VI secretion system protein ImpL